MNPASFSSGEGNSCFAVAATISNNPSNNNQHKATTKTPPQQQSTTDVAAAQSYDRGIVQRLNHYSCAVAATQNSRIIIQHQHQQQQHQQQQQQHQHQQQQHQQQNQQQQTQQQQHQQQTQHHLSIAAATQQDAYFGPFATVNNNQQQSDNQSALTFTQNMQSGLNSYNFLFNSIPGQLSGTVNNLGVCLDLQFPEPNQIDFQYLQRIQQDSQWEKFYQECFQQKQGTYLNNSFSKFGANLLHTKKHSLLVFSKKCTHGKQRCKNFF